MADIYQGDSYGVLKYIKLLRKLDCFKILGITFILIDSEVGAPNWACRMGIGFSKTLNLVPVYAMDFALKVRNVSKNHLSSYTVAL